jgi:two-component system, cell cycle response regulator CpdR
MMRSALMIGHGDGYEVLAANCGTDGLAMCRQSIFPVQLLVTDFNMPDMSGLELARGCTRINRDLSVLYVSGSEPNEELREELKGRKRGFLGKPFRGSDLLRKTKELFLAEPILQLALADGTFLAHDHGSQYQVKVIHEDGTEALSEWMNHGNVAQAMAVLRKPQVRSYWLRERNVIVAACLFCSDRETAIAEYPLTDCFSHRSRPNDSNHLASTGSRDSSDLYWMRSKFAGC